MGSLIGSSDCPNIFTSLFSLLPTQKENFLTKSFAYVLGRDRGAAEAWLSTIFDERLSVAHAIVRTQPPQKAEGCERTFYPDMTIEAETHSGQYLTVYSEHKWDAQCTPGQLEKYAKLLTDPTKRQVLVFIGAKRKQVDEAKSCEQLNAAFLWENVYETLAPLPDTMVQEFLAFMKAHKLDPGDPITPDLIHAHITSLPFLPRLERYADKLLNDYDWSFLAQPQRKGVKPPAVVHDTYGRVVLAFHWREDCEDWNPAMTIGFLYDPHDHGVEFMSQDSIDLILRIEADPKKFHNPVALLDALKPLAPKLQSNDTRALIKDQRGNGNQWNLLIVQRSLARVVEGCPTERQQLDAIYKQTKEWCITLFSDGRVENALRNMQPDK